MNFLFCKKEFTDANIDIFIFLSKYIFPLFIIRYMYEACIVNTRLFGESRLFIGNGEASFVNGRQTFIKRRAAVVKRMAVIVNGRQAFVKGRLSFVNRTAFIVNRRQSFGKGGAFFANLVASLNTKSIKNYKAFY